MPYVIGVHYNQSQAGVAITDTAVAGIKRPRSVQNIRLNFNMVFAICLDLQRLFPASSVPVRVTAIYLTSQVLLAADNIEGRLAGSALNVMVCV